MKERKEKIVDTLETLRNGSLLQLVKVLVFLSIGLTLLLALYLQATHWYYFPSLLVFGTGFLAYSLTLIYSWIPIFEEETE